MNGISYCRTCKKEFKWYRDKTRKSPEYCSVKCFSAHPKTWISENHKRLREDPEHLKKKYNTRFEDKVIKKEGCWDWKGCIHSSGYPSFKDYGGKNGTAHRASWIIYKGEIPNGLFVLHKCDNKKCTNPDHLFLGTSQNNAEDRQKKHRGKKQKLIENQVVEIRKLYNMGVTQKRLATDFKVSSNSIWKIVNRITWKYI